MQRGCVPPRGGSKADALTLRVNSRVGSTGCVRDCAVTEDAFEDPLEFDLNRTAGRLPLPSDKAGAVIVKRGEEGPAHGAEFSREEIAEQGCNCLSELTKAARSGYTFPPPAPPMSSPLSEPRSHP